MIATRYEDEIMAAFLPPESNRRMFFAIFCLLRLVIALAGYEDNIKSRRQEKEEKKVPGCRAKRWVM